MFYNKKIHLITAVSLIVCQSLIASAQSKAPAAIKDLPLDPLVRTGKLSNGFTYYIRHNEEPKNRVLMYLVNKVGSNLEDEDQRGLAHFTEHMSFNGTTHFPHNELVNYLQKAGVRFGADINAYTSFDETVYELPLPSDQPSVLAKGILIMHDWAQSAVLDPGEINKERGVVLEEKRLGKGATERMQREYWPVILNNSRYAVRQPIGLDTVLNNFKRPAIARFYHDWYRPDLQALIIVGDIDAKAMERMVRMQFSDLKNPVRQRTRAKYQVPLTGKNNFIAVTDKEMPSTVAEIMIKHPSLVLKTGPDYRKAMIRQLFNQMLAERYAELSRQADPPYVECGASISGFIGGLDIYGLSVTAKPGELEKGLKAAWRETERVKRFGFTLSELERAKLNYLNGMEAALKEKDKIKSDEYVKAYQVYFLNGTATPGIETEYALTKNDLPGITLDEVNKLAETYITAINRDILIMAPVKDKPTLPNESEVNGWLKSVNEEKLSPYKDEVSHEPFLSKALIPGKITDEQRNKGLNIISLTLNNGVKVVLKPTTFKNNEILFSAFAPGGTSLASDADYESAAGAINIIPAGGLNNYTLTQLGKYLSGKELKVAPFISDRFEGISGISTTKDLETALQLVYAYFTGPRKDTTVFKGIIERSVASLANRSDDPGSVFNDTVSAVMGNYNIRRTGPSVQKVQQVNLDKAYAFYKQRFADASNFTFTFVGNIDTVAIRPLLEKYLGSLPATHQNEQAKDLGIHIPTGRISKTLYKGSEPRATVLLVYSGDFNFDASSLIRLDALKETLQIRLLERLREDESGVYTPSISENAFKYPSSRYNMVIQFGCAPQNVEKLISSTLDEINELRISGPSQENVDKWRAEDKSSMEPELKTNGFWMGYLQGQLQNQESWDQINDYPALRDKVTPADVKEMALKYLSGSNFIRLVLMPEKKAN